MINRDSNNYCLYMHIAPNNKKYIGITSTTVKNRWGNNGIGYKTQRLFYRAIQKYGWDNFQHIVLLTNLSADWACKLEMYLILAYKSNDANYGYNVSCGGESTLKGLTMSDEAREHMRLAHLGKPLSYEHRKNISLSHKGYKQSLEHIKHASQARIGKKLSAEHRKHLSESHKGHVNTREQIQKQAKSLHRTIQNMSKEERIQKYGKSSKGSPVLLCDCDGNEIAKFESSRKCADYLGVCPAMVCMLISGKRKSDRYTITKL